jgi:hypothetical protein
MSDPETTADHLKNSAFISLSGKSGEAMTVQNSIMFVFGDQYKSNLLATVNIQI